MANHELIDRVALKLSERTDVPAWFNNLELKINYSQLKLCKKTRKQCKFSIDGRNITGTYQFLTGFYGHGDMPNELQRLIN